MPLPQNPLDWNDLKYFLAIARIGTLRGAADSIQTNHATVSRKLNILEENLGTKLFDRTQSGLVLTQSGEELLPHACKIEEEIHAASRSILGRDLEPSGPIYFSMPPILAMTFIMDDLADFSKQYKDIDLHIDLSNTMLDLTRREADVTIRIASEVFDDVVGRKLCSYTKAAYCSSEYIDKITDNGGAGLNWIGWMETEGKKTAKWISESAFPHATLKNRAPDGVTQLGLAAAGMGLTLAPCFIGDNHPNLVRAPYQKSYLDTRHIWLLLHRDLRKNARIRLFVDFLALRIKKRRNDLMIHFKN